MEKETWVGIAWAVGLFAAMGGVFAYEVANFELESFEVAFNETLNAGSYTGDLVVGEAYTFSPTVSGTNFTFFTAQLTWVDDYAPADTFTLRVTSPGGNVSETSASTGDLSVTVDLGQVPGHFEIEGVDLEDAKSAAASQLAPTMIAAANGTWVVEAILDAAPPVASGSGTPDPASCDFVASDTECDGSNRFLLQVYWGNYSAVFGDEAHKLIDAADGAGEHSH